MRFADPEHIINLLSKLNTRERVKIRTKCMSRLTTLITGAGIQTPVNSLTQLDNIIVIGDVDTAFPLQALKVDIDNDTKIFINSAPILGAFAKWMNNIVGTVVGLALKIGSGRVYGRNIAVTLTNNGVTTPVVYAFSDDDNGEIFEATTVVVNANSYVDLDRFSSVMVASPTTTVSSVEVQFTNGCKTTIGVEEAAALFVSMGNAAETDGFLNGCLVFDNRFEKISKLRIYTTANPMTYCLFKFNQQVWDAYKRRGK